MRCLKRAYKNWVLIATPRFNFYSRLVPSNNYISFEVLRKAVVTSTKLRLDRFEPYLHANGFTLVFPRLARYAFFFFLPECWLLTSVKAWTYERHCARCRAKWLNFLCNIACNDNLNSSANQIAFRGKPHVARVHFVIYVSKSFLRDNKTALDVQLKKEYLYWLVQRLV